jgi:hypothetical protein
VEVVSTNDWGTQYEAPGGEGFSPMFDDARFVIMAQRANTIVRIDLDDDGIDDIIQTLGEGQSFVVDGILVGSRVLSNLPVQVTFLTSDIGSNYEMRWYGMVPVSRWTDSYIAPVSTTNAAIPTTVLLYNPHATALSVDVTTTGGTTNVSAAGASATPPRSGLFNRLTLLPISTATTVESEWGHISCGEPRAGRQVDGPRPSALGEPQSDLSYRRLATTLNVDGRRRTVAPCYRRLDPFDFRHQGDQTARGSSPRTERSSPPPGDRMRAYPRQRRRPSTSEPWCFRPRMFRS